MEEVEAAVTAARGSLSAWSRRPFEERVVYLRRYVDRLKNSDLEVTISEATGKPLWESKQEVTAMLLKLDVSLAAFRERCPEKKIEMGKASLYVHHKPQGVVAIFGPYNFPGHLPNGHIIPALLAGNTVIFKGSEFTQAVSREMA